MAENKVNKIVKFEMSTENLKVKKALSKDFLVVEMQAISSAKPNRNGSHFTKSSMDQSINSFYNKPVLASFNRDIDDFGEHNGKLKHDLELGNPYFDYTDPGSETPIGMIRQEDKVAIVYHEDEDLYWIHFTCAIWVKYSYRQVKRLLKRGSNKVSVEIEVLSSHEEDGIEIIDEFVFDGVTLLGNSIMEGIAGAHLNIIDTINNATFKRKQKCLSFAYSELNQSPDSEISVSDVDDSDFNEDLNFTIQSREDLIKYFSDSCCSCSENININENTDDIIMNEKGGNSNMNVQEEIQVQNEDFSCGENKEVEACTEQMSCEKETEACENESCETKSCENKETESCIDSTSCYESDDNEDDKDDDDDCKCENESCEKNSCENESCEKEVESCEGKETETCKTCETCEEMTAEMSCGDKEQESCIDSTSCYEDNKEDMSIVPSVVADSSAVFDSANFVAKSEYDAAVAELENIKAQFATLQEQYNSLQNEMNAKVNAEWFSVGNGMIQNASELDDSIKTEFSSDLKNRIDKKEFSSVDEVKKFAKTQIALAIYDMNHNENNEIIEKAPENKEFAQSDSNENKVENNDVQNKENKEFVSDINTTPVTPVSASGAEKLREAKNKLNKI